MNTRLTRKTLKTYIKQDYIPFLQQKREKESGFKKDVGVLNIICGYQLVEKRMCDINENDLVVFFQKLKSERSITTTTTNRYRSRLHNIFNHAIKARVLMWNPVQSINRYKEVSRTRCLSIEEVQQLLFYSKYSLNLELFPIIMTALYTGMRLNEILDLRVFNIVGNSICLKGGQTKSKTDRTIPIHEQILPYILKLAKDRDSQDNLFQSKNIRSAFSKALERAGIKNFRFHDLRRTFASGLLESGADLNIIKNLLGHSSIKMTEIYLASSSNKTIDAIKKLWFG